MHVFMQNGWSGAKAPPCSRCHLQRVARGSKSGATGEDYREVLQGGRANEIVWTECRNLHLPMDVVWHPRWSWLANGVTGHRRHVDEPHRVGPHQVAQQGKR